MQRVFSNWFLTVTVKTKKEEEEEKEKKETRKISGLSDKCHFLSLSPQQSAEYKEVLLLMLKTWAMV